MKVTVYLGANMGDNPSFKKATIALGQWIAKNGHTLVYGGSKMGLMGVLGDTVLENAKMIDDGYGHHVLEPYISFGYGLSKLRDAGFKDTSSST